MLPKHPLPCSRGLLPGRGNHHFIIPNTLEAFSFPPLNGYIKLKMNGNCFSIRGDGSTVLNPFEAQKPWQ